MVYSHPAPVDAIVVSMCSARDLRAAVKLLLKRTYPQLLRARHLMEDTGISAAVSPLASVRSSNQEGCVS